MPHTILEYSDNILDPPDFQPLWARLHPVLVETAHCQLQDIKSRAYRCEAYRMGDGDPANAFIHFTVRLLDGRDPETLAKVGAVLLELLKDFFEQTLAGRQCQISVELVEMRRCCFFKATSRT